MGFDKLFAQIAGKAVIAHSIFAFQRATSVSEIIVVAREDRRQELEKLVRDENFTKIRSIVTGGEHRHDSVRAGLEHVSSDAKYVAVHDAARPLVVSEQIEDVFEACRIHGGASLAEPVTDTLKRAQLATLDSRSGQVLVVADSVDRNRVYAMQTPQIFARDVLEEAYHLVGQKKIFVTDEVSAVELLGRKIALIVNEQFNLKITYPRDLHLAEFILRQRKG